MTEDRTPKRDFAIHVNQVELLGRVTSPAKEQGEFARIPIVVPTWGRDETQWIPFILDIVGDHRAKVMKATVGDFLRCSAKLVDRPVVDDNNEGKTVKVLQVDTFREVGVMPAEAPENPDNPPHYGICYSRILLAGRNFIRKKQMEEGKGNTPILREGRNNVYCFVNMRYEDPFQPPPQGDEKYFKSMFIDFAVNGEPAKIVSQYCRNRAQIIVRGELVKRELDFTMSGGKTPKEPRVRLLPGGLSFVNLDVGGGGAKTEDSPKGYDKSDTSGLDLGEASSSSETKPAAPASNDVMFEDDIPI